MVFPYLLYNCVIIALAQWKRVSLLPWQSWRHSFNIYAMAPYIISASFFLGWEQTFLCCLLRWSWSNDNNYVLYPLHWVQKARCFKGKVSKTQALILFESLSSVGPFKFSKSGEFKIYVFNLARLSRNLSSFVTIVEPLSVP